DLHEALSLAFPGLAVAPLGAVLTQDQATDFTPIPMRGLPVHVADLVGKADPRLVAFPLREAEPPQHVLFGASNAQSALSDAIRIITQARQPMTLRLNLTPRRLSSKEIRQLSDLYR